MGTSTLGLVGLASCFAVVTGVNDGGSLVAAGSRVPSLRVIHAMVILVVAVGVGPVVFGTRVAATFTDRLVSFDAAGGRVAAAVGVVVAILVVGALTAKGLPTSLTLAVVGGLTGAGLGYGLPVHLAWLLFVLGLGVAAPLVGGALAWVLTVGSRLVPARRMNEGAVGNTHPFTFSLQCLAYAANDGQKMLAVLALGSGSIALGGRGAPPLAVAWIAVLFALGVVVGLPRVSHTLGEGIFPLRPFHAVTAEVAASAAVLISAALGAPVSMTQSLAGGILGVGVADGRGRIRWHPAIRMVFAWLLTLPVSVAIAAGCAALLAQAN